MRDGHDGVEGAELALRLALGLGFLAVGVDKFFDRLATWSMYVSPLAERLLPVSGEAFMRAVGVGEALLGAALLLPRWSRLAGAAAALWLLAIAANLAAAGTFWDLALRDLQLAAGAFALARLASFREARRHGAAPEAGSAPSRWADPPPGTRSTT
jgi:uncharacterized membrane protein YphA (DoxX/SURF4 family)